MNVGGIEINNGLGIQDVVVLLYYYTAKRTEGRWYYYSGVERQYILLGRLMCKYRINITGSQRDG